MNKDLIFYILLFIVMVLVQVLICNHILLFGVAAPLVFVYFIIRLPMGLSTNWLLTLSFILGLTVDIFSDTPGVDSLACTLLAIARRPVFYAYVPRDDRTKDIAPSLSTLGPGTYAKYLVTMVSIFCLLAFSIEYFNFANVREIVVMAGSSALLTFVLLLGIDSLVVTKA